VASTRIRLTEHIEGDGARDFPGVLWLELVHRWPAV
jgi:hypothetical protein